MTSLPAIPKLLIGVACLLALLACVVAILPAGFHVIGDCSEYYETAWLQLPLMLMAGLYAWWVVRAANRNLVGTNFDKGLLLGGAAAATLALFSPFALTRLFFLVELFDFDMQALEDVGMMFLLAFVGVVALMVAWSLALRGLLGAAFTPAGAWFPLFLYAYATGAIMLRGVKPGPMLGFWLFFSVLMWVFIRFGLRPMFETAMIEAKSLARVMTGLTAVCVLACVLAWNAFGLVYRVATMNPTIGPTPSPYAGTKWRREASDPKLTYIGPWRIGSTRSVEQTLYTIVSPFSNGDARALHISLKSDEMYEGKRLDLHLRIARAGDRVALKQGEKPTGTCVGWKPGGSDPLHYELIGIPPSMPSAKAMRFIQKFVSEHVGRDDT